MGRKCMLSLSAKFSGVLVLSTWMVGCAGGDEPATNERFRVVEQASRNAGPPWCEGKAKPNPLPTNVRRNVILVIADGQQLEDEIAISRYLYGRDFAMTWDQFPYQAHVATWDVTSYNDYARAAGKTLYTPASYDPLVGYDPAQAGDQPYPLSNPEGLFPYLTTLIKPNKWWAATDSASAATAMATGVKTDDGNIAWPSGDPPNAALETVGETLRTLRGMSFGVVSTQAFTAATPAAFSAHNPSRNDTAGIATEITTRTKPDVVIGGGFGLTFSLPPDEYVFVARSSNPGGPALLVAADQAVAEGKKLFGLFGANRGSIDLGSATDTPGAPTIIPGSPQNPTLAESSTAAMKVLSQNPSGFFLMIEQGDIDTANHANNFQQMIACAADLENAIASVIDFVDQPNDDIDWENTVLMVVADHATGYLRLAPDKTLGQGDLPTQVYACVTDPVTGKRTCAWTYPDGDVNYATGGHSNELVHLSIVGHMAGALSACEGNEYPGTRILNNTVLHSFMLRAAGL